MDWNGPAAKSILFINHERFLVKDLLEPASVRIFFGNFTG